MIHMMIRADVFVVDQQAAGLEHAVHEGEHVVDAVEMVDRGLHEDGVEAAGRQIVFKHVARPHFDAVR